VCDSEYLFAVMPAIPVDLRGFMPDSDEIIPELVIPTVTLSESFSHFVFFQGIDCSLPDPFDAPTLLSYQSLLELDHSQMLLSHHTSQPYR
jgi:hypothetical protein